MDRKILPNLKDAIFEPHTFAGRVLPISTHIMTVADHQVQATRLGYHEDIECLYIKEGQAQVFYGDHTHSVSAGDIIIVNSYVPHQISTSSPAVYYSMIISKEYCKENHIDINKLYFQELIQDTRLCKLLETTIVERKVKKPFRLTALRHAVLEILLILCREYRTPRSTARATKHLPEYIPTAVTYINTNLDKKLTADAVSTYVGLSKYYFLREFKRVTGTTLIHYITSVRCEQAKKLLRTGQYKVKQVAFLCGFEDESYFSSVFKKHTGVLPSEFLKSTGL